jgi:ECF transporter S component (folate family)
MREKSLARDTAILGLLIAMQIVFLRLISLETQNIRIDFVFIPIALCAIMYGPLKGGLCAAAGDVLSFLLFPPPFPFFPGFTFTAFLSGVIFGLCLYRKPKSVIRFAIAVIVICIVKNLTLDTLWIAIIHTENFFAQPMAEMLIRLIALMPVRVIHLILIPVQIITLSLLWKYLIGHLESRFAPAIKEVSFEVSQ